MIRDDIKAALITAMKGGDKAGTATLRLVQSAIKNRDIEARTGKAPEDDYFIWDDEPPVSAEVGAGSLNGHAASRILSSVLSAPASSVARKRYAAAASAFAAAVMIARESLRSTRSQDPI